MPPRKRTATATARNSKAALSPTTARRTAVTSHKDLHNNSSPRPSRWHIWKTAARPHTLTASICPCLVAAAACPTAPLTWQLVWLLFCVTVQLGTNIHNDYADFVRGADTDQRIGHARATALGWWTPAETCRAATVTLSITTAAGVSLVALAEQWHNAFLWFLIGSSVFNAFAYTGGPYPLGYLGLEHVSIAYSGAGDVFVFLYFGLTATLMVPYLLTVSSGHSSSSSEMTTLWPQMALYSIQVGLLATNIIVVNNLRDRHTDVSASKLTTSVRFGRRFSIIEYTACLVISYSLVLVDFVWADWSLLRLLPLVSLPVAYREMISVIQKDGADLNEHVGGTAKVQFLFCILLSVALRLS